MSFQKIGPHDGLSESVATCVPSWKSPSRHPAASTGSTSCENGSASATGTHESALGFSPAIMISWTLGIGTVPFRREEACLRRGITRVISSQQMVFRLYTFPCGSMTAVPIISRREPRGESRENARIAACWIKRLKGLDVPPELGSYQLEPSDRAPGARDETRGDLPVGTPAKGVRNFRNG
jgi:hypothetical protein